MNNFSDDYLINLLNIDTSLPVDENFPKWILSLILIQAILTLIGMHAFLVFAVVFKKRTLFHWNLKVLSINTAVLFFIVMFCRFIIAVSGLFNWRIIGRLTSFTNILD